MIPSDALFSDAAERRRRAEDVVAAQAAPVPESAEVVSLEPTEESLHEPRAHQAELELEKERPRRASVAGPLDVMDMTERERETEMLTRIMAAVESAGDAIGISDAQGHHVYQNRALTDLFGYATAEELQAAGGGPAVVRDPAVARQMFAAIMEGKSWAGELQMVTKSGRVFPAFERADAILDGSGHTVGLVGVISDMSERKQAEEALLAAGRLWQRTVDAIPDMVCVISRDSEFLGANRATREALSLAAPDLQGKKCFELVHGTAAPIPGCPCIKALTTRRPESAEHAENGRCYELSAIPILDETGEASSFVHIVRDLTTRKHAEAEKATLEARLHQAQRMESVGRLAGGVAHDFNNMLSVILGHAELALAELAPSQPLYDALIEIRAAASRSAKLTRQLLAFARKQTVAPVVLNLNETVESMLAMLRRLIGEDIDLRWAPASSAWPIKVDPSQIDQILANLCVNARDAIIGLGKISIETANVTFDDSHCATNSGYLPGDYVRLAVSDDGCGMDASVQANLFEPFFTTKDLGKGTGLGLATVYGIVKQNHGFINVYSEVGIGTTFTVYLPRHRAEAAQTRTKRAPNPASRGDETILVVEDDPAVLKITTRMLSGLGYTVLSACSPAEALGVARNCAAEIHLVMTDVVMPEMNGRDLAANLLSLYPNLKCLFTSGYTANVIAHHGVLDADVHFLEKPFSVHDLAPKVREVLGSR